VITPETIELIDIDTMLSVSPKCTPDKQVESDAQYFSSIQLVGDAGSKNSLTKLPGHETASLQEMETGGGRGDAAEMGMTVTADTPRRRSMWRRAKRFARRIFCCGQTVT